LEANALRQCLSSASAKAKLDRDIAEGRRLQVNATPTVFVNGKRLEQIEGFLKAIESESKRLGLPMASP
ncbi:MAG: DsbA family protein, partial [Vicinamibacteria bacterium]